MDYNIIFTIKEPYNVEYTTDDISLGTEIKETFDKYDDITRRNNNEETTE